ncbi:hypothetical protein [Saccharopolyspora sp. ASAGF58]|uniref:hypothetical protein n=1 Tax=Saccharopolyspora sp. ASAGF58 TaxID=2719023 RepID=UPI001446A97D|nr:hypothetical protein [Saccharopolyspora sp. ASAGF58]
MRQAPEIAELVGAADIVLLDGHHPLLADAALKCESPGPRGWLQRLPELAWHRRLRREE